MIKKAKSFFKVFIKSICFDVKFLRTMFFMFFFNLIPNLLVLRLVKNLFLILAGIKTGINDAYVLSPFYVTYAGNIRLGKGTFLNEGVRMEGNAEIVIGECCQIGPFCMFENTNHQGEDLEFLPIKIGNKVWIGAGSIILPNTTIYNDKTIAAGAVVRDVIADGSLWGGVPAKLLK